MAKADAKAELIRAQSELEVDALKRRALERFVTEEAKKQSNIEEITHKAVPLLEEKSDPKNLDDDWISNFFDKCRIVSDIEMQQLWSKVLAGEANAPRKFSKRTINLLSDLDKADAELLSKLCGFAWNIETRITLLIFDFNHSIYNKNGITFESLCHLESLGLIQLNLSGYGKAGLPDKFDILYYGRYLTLERQDGADKYLSIGIVHLTKAGEQLAEICGSTSVDGLYEYVIGQFKFSKYLPV